MEWLYLELRLKSKMEIQLYVTRPCFMGYINWSRRVEVSLKGSRGYALLAFDLTPDFNHGEHWVSFYLLSEREGDFFDSYGHPPGSLDPKFRKWMTSVVSNKNAQLFYN